MPTYAEKADVKQQQAREAVSDAVRPNEPSLAEKAQRGARDTAFAAKEGTEKALNAVSDAINPDRKKV